MQSIKPAERGVIMNIRMIGVIHNVQITRHRGTGSDLRGHTRRAVLIGVTESSRVNESERLGVIQQCVENRTSVENNNLVKIAMLGFEEFHIIRELSVVVG